MTDNNGSGRLVKGEVMLELKKNLKAAKGIVSRRKPKKTGVGAKCPTKKESDLRKFNLSLPNELLVQIVAAAAAKNMKVNAFIASALRAELQLPTVAPAPVAAPKLNELKTFLDGMSTFDWTQALTLNEEEQKKKSDVNS